MQLAKEARAWVIATASPRSAARVKAASAGEVFDLILNLAPIVPGQSAALLPLIRDGGKLVNTAVGVPAPSNPQRDVRGIGLFVRSDGDQLADLVARVNTSELLINIAQRVALADLPPCTPGPVPSRGSARSSS